MSWPKFWNAFLKPSSVVRNDSPLTYSLVEAVAVLLGEEPEEEEERQANTRLPYRGPIDSHTLIEGNRKPEAEED